MRSTSTALVLFILCLILVVESFLQQPLNILVSELFKRRSDQARYVVPPKSRAGRTRQPNDQTSNPRSPTTSEASSSRKLEISIPKPRSFAMKNIQGQNTIICREFKIDSPKTFDFLGSFRSSNQLPIYPLPEIAFIGRSNVGKSSLINCLTNLNKKVVITSKTPGRTQGINLIKCNDREGDICVLADLPGYGFAKISKELQREISNFVNEYIMQRDALRLCIVLLDARREPLESDYNTLKVGSILPINKPFFHYVFSHWRRTGFLSPSS